MSVDDHTLTDDLPRPAPIVFSPPERRRRFRVAHGAERPPRPRLRKLRFLLILGAFAILAIVSAVFGMLMAVASDLPQLENTAQYQHAVNSYMYDDTGRPIGVLAAPDHRVIDTFFQVSRSMRQAIVAVEDRRFWSDPGVDIRGLARAFVSDVSGGPRQGASTIAEQFVKNALAQQGNRTIFEKLREAVLAYHLTRRWKRGKILQEYLNTIYFGRGAYGIESAARVYFGYAHGYSVNATDPSVNACGDPNAKDPHRPKCASELNPWESALLAGMVANPTAFDPILHPQAARERRNLVLRDMLALRDITREQYDRYANYPLPTAADLQQPQEPAAAPYFTSWVRPQIVGALERAGIPPSLASYKAFYGGLKIRLTIDLQLQQAAQQAIDAEFPPGSDGPTAALVAIDNKTGEVRAMVSGNRPYQEMPFNLATLGYRQPGSSFKPFTLAEALMTGEYGPDSIIDSAPQDFIVPNSRGREHFIVHNFGNTYSGPITLAEATAISDNSVYAQVGIHVGTARIAHLAQQMGIRSPLSHNYAMILGGLKQGVSALDMAHAYETFATGGVKVYNHVLGDPGGGPVGIHALLCPSCPFKRLVNHPTYQRILPATVAQSIRTILEGVVSSGGTAPLAAIPGVLVAGKTGTTSNYVDAWFVGWTPQMTTAVWVGYPDRAIPMSTAYGGKPVEGGTFPAIIWHNFMTQALQILAAEHPATGATTTTVAPITGTPGAGAAATPTTGTAPASAVTPAGGGAAGPATGTGTPAAGTGHTGTPPAGGGTAGGTGATPGATTGGTTGGTGGTTGATGGTGGTTGGTGGTTGGTGGTGGTTGGTGGTGGAGVGGGSG